MQLKNVILQIERLFGRAKTINALTGKLFPQSIKLVTKIIT